MGSYWETYVFTSLQTNDAMTPVPFEGQEFRTLWTQERIRLADKIVVEYGRSKLSDEHGPPQHLNQFGNSLLLIDPNWYRNGEYAFALYLNEKR
jgi:hypothetical protein